MSRDTKKTRVILLGGFLGAGKTTTVIGLARQLESMGLKVAVITNDQGSLLVDGGLVNIHGISGTEITGGCLCCRIHELTRAMDTLLEKVCPDVLIAEPVGSCTDLVSTVFFPLKEHYQGRFSLAPFAALADVFVLKGLYVDDSFPFSGAVRYLYEKQLEEANILLVNKTEQLDTDDVQLVLEAMKARYPGRTVLPFSAKHPSSLETLAHILLQREDRFQPLDEIDYNLYGEAESQLGWYNGALQFQRSRVFDPNDITEELLTGLQDILMDRGAHIAHIKVIGSGTGGTIKASVVHEENSPDFTLKAYDLVKQLDLVINARVEIEPCELDEIVSQQISNLCNLHQILCKMENKECFKPSPPTPVYRR